MSETPRSISVRILDRDYQFTSTSEQEAGLHQAAKLLDGRMKEIRDKGRVVGHERIAVMAALNIIYEMIHESSKSSPTDSKHLKKLANKIEDALASASQLELT